MPRDSGKIYYRHRWRTSARGEGRVSVTIEDKTYSGTWVAGHAPTAPRATSPAATAAATARLGRLQAAAASSPMDNPNGGDANGRCSRRPTARACAATSAARLRTRRRRAAATTAGSEYDVQFARGPQRQPNTERTDHAPQRLQHPQDLPASPPGKRASSTRCPRSRRPFPNVMRAAGLASASCSRSVLRNCDGKKVTEEHVKQLANWKPNGDAHRRDPVRRRAHRAAGLHRRAAARRPRRDAQRRRASMGKNPKVIEPLVPVDLVVDHSVQIDHYGSQGRARPQHEARVPAQQASATSS